MTVKTLLSDESGAGIIEYALLVVFIALVAVLSVELVGNSANEIFSEIGSTISN